MRTSPNHRRHLSVLCILTVCAASAAWAGFYNSQPAASASRSPETNAAARALGPNALTPASTIVVNSTADVQNNSDGLCTLREALTAANTDTASGATAGECVAGSGDDTIDLTGATGTVTLTSALPAIATGMTLTGPGASQLTISGNNSFTIFYLSLITGQVTVSGLTISHGKASSGVGGGLYNESGASVEVRDCKFTNNSAVLGGAIANGYGPLTVINTTVSNNTAGTGGGIYCGSGALVTVINSTVNNNSATNNNGGGIINGSGTLNVINSTIANNTAFNGGGAGIYNNGINAPINVTNCTISGNTSFRGGGINNEFGTTHTLNTIIAMNSATNASPDVYGSFNSRGHNFIGKNDGSSGFTNGANDDIVGSISSPANPLLSSLAGNGGSIETMALQSGSPAIDEADSCVLANTCSITLPLPLTTDERGFGFTRAADGNGDANASVDIGAYEFQGLLVTNTNDSGTGSLRQAIIDANANSDTSAINFQSGLTGTISLLTALPTLSTSMAINGPGASVLTVQRSTAGGTPNFRIFAIGSGAGVTISGLTISNGNAEGTPPSNDGYGGGIFNQGTLTLNDSNVYGNTSLSVGGGIYHAGLSLTINNSNIGGLAAGQPNSSGDWGATAGIHAEEPVIINGGSISGNTGGSGVTLNSTGTLNGVTISGNVNKLHGGGVVILPEADVAIVNCLISGNRTIPANGQGGGIHNVAGSLALINSTVSGNQAQGSGGGVFYTDSVFNPNATMRVVNSTITNNRADADGFNGGAENGGGIAADDDLLLSNSLVAGNFFGPGSVANDVSTTVSSSSSFNLIGVCDACSLTNGVNNNQVGVANPGLAVLADNGGLTLTHALLAGSPALDAGSNALSDGEVLTTDQRGPGFSRKADASDINTTQTVDIGAFEAQASVEDIADKSTPEDTPLSFGFNVGDAAAITNVTASSANTTVVPNLPANLSVTGSGSTRTLNITPTANQFGTSTITVTVTAGTQSMSDTFVLTVHPVAETPSVTSASTFVNSQTTSGLVISRNVLDGAEVTHFKITNITNGTLFKNNGTTQITNDSFITFAEGNAGLRFTPSTNLVSPSSAFSFQMQGATNSGGAGLGPAITAAITVDCGPTVVTNTNNGGAGSLRQTILSACPGTTITFNIPTNDPGISGGVYRILLTSDQLVIDKNLTIAGLGEDLLTIARSSAVGTPNFRIFNVQSGVTVVMSGLTIASGFPNGLGNQVGGNIFNNGTLTLNNSTVRGGAAAPSVGTGGGIFNNTGATLTLNSSKVTGNSATGGAGILNSGTLLATNTTFSDNVAVINAGGAIYNNGQLTLVNSTLSGNFGGGGAGGIFNSSSGTVTLINGTVSGNIGGSGAGIFNGGNFALTNVTVSGNSSPTIAGGIYNGAGALTLTNVTVTNNRSDSNNSGGEPGGGVYGGGGTVILRNAIVAGNFRGTGSTADDISGSLDPTSSFNLIGTCNSCGLANGFNNNQVGISSPVLGSLANNGGPRLTHLPLLGSPAINAGSNALLPADTFDLDGDANTAEQLPVDQRAPGFARIVNTTVDIGAVEANYTIAATAGTPQTATIGSAFGTLLQATVKESGNNQSGIPVTFTPPASGASGSFSGSATVNTDASGIATAPVFTANGIGGSYNVVASLVSGWPSANFSLANLSTISINDVTITEGNAGTASLTFTITLAAASNLTVTVDYATANGSATTADNDYQSTSNTLQFNPGELTKTVTVSVNGDQKTEADETVFVVLSNPVNAVLSDSQGQGTIINDDDLQLLLDTSGPDANQLAALDSLLLTRDPFRVANQAPWLSSEQNTRVILFALNLNSGESPSNVKVMLVDGNGGTHEVPADDARAIADTAFTQVTFRLPDGLAQGSCLVSIKAHERISNTGTFRIAP